MRFAAWCMILLGLVSAPVAWWITDEPVMLVLMSSGSLVFEGVIAMMVVGRS